METVVKKCVWIKYKTPTGRRSTISGDPEKTNQNIKCRIFKTNIISVLLYGRKCWKMTTVSQLHLYNWHLLNQVSTKKECSIVNRNNMTPLLTVKRRWQRMGHIWEWQTNPYTQLWCGFHRAISMWRHKETRRRSRQNSSSDQTRVVVKSKHPQYT